MYLEAIKFVCEMVTKLWVFKHSPLVLKIAPTTTLIRRKQGLTANEAAMPIKKPPFYSSMFHSIRAVIQKLVYCSRINL